MGEDFSSKALYGVFGGLIALLLTAVGVVVGFVIGGDSTDGLVVAVAVAGGVGLALGIGLGFATFYISTNLFHSSNAIE